MMAANNQYYFFWFGGTDVAEHNVWRWTDGSLGRVEN